ncbi:hypothetical protein E1B28_010699 [Marasmius oreades]|uniref:Uncharacterized protein n=1 Tax=Marasmius oreades TaxID=181124 RepID=A0A9P7RXT3_9AGAR|nr:uncharacterized protein E1B28_010699 [Marasmius oreades]KAG7091679.1 hypothetical protein E1B28_010699 [Marasmius oreades]
MMVVTLAHYSAFSSPLRPGTSTSEIQRNAWIRVLFSQAHLGSTSIQAEIQAFTCIICIHRLVSTTQVQQASSALRQLRTLATLREGVCGCGFVEGKASDILRWHLWYRSLSARERL